MIFFIRKLFPTKTLLDAQLYVWGVPRAVLG